MLLRVPGFGTKTVDRILRTRRTGRLRYDDLLRMGASFRKAQPFIELADWQPGALLDAEGLRARFAPAPRQLSLFDAADTPLPPAPPAPEQPAIF
jgi:predicted DNA-binding helix-hairpin-helix protein